MSKQVYYINVERISGDSTFCKPGDEVIISIDNHKEGVTFINLKGQVIGNIVDKESVEHIASMKHPIVCLVHCLVPNLLFGQDGYGILYSDETSYKNLKQVGAKLSVKQRELPEIVSIKNLNPTQEAMQKRIEYKFKMREEMESLRQTLEYFHEKCESPPELILYDAARRHGINLIPQYTVPGISGKRYRLDFAIVKPGYRTLGIEVISKEFHKDKDADRRREKDMELNGIIIQGFSAVRCQDQPEACAVEIKERLIRL